MLGEILQSRRGEAIPVPAKEMIVNDVDDHPGKAPQGGGETGCTGSPDRMGIGECIHLAVMGDALPHEQGKIGESIDGATNKIPEIGTDQSIGQRWGEVKVRQKVHGRGARARSKAIE